MAVSNAATVRGWKSRFSECAKREAVYEPWKEHAAPTELEEGPSGVVGYRHGAPTELLVLVRARERVGVVFAIRTRVERCGGQGRLLVPE